ncbi:hypothetical protein [Candidatus Accumulibacter sp. ACC003]|uniref:hypothetical protein n=1 Tax=Candidatus Accumulibacter sp. ACC003 TaxID=2823334 RepID=UPI0025BDA8F7|nr:hypothetical protein [Candidatus Accumulibacter sp. ACC003]
MQSENLAASIENGLDEMDRPACKHSTALASCVKTIVPSASSAIGKRSSRSRGKPPVVERAIPFAAYPPDIARAARSLGVTICIAPGRGGGFGFSRMADDQHC